MIMMVFKKQFMIRTVVDLSGLMCSRLQLSFLEYTINVVKIGIESNQYKFSADYLLISYKINVFYTCARSL